MSFRLKILLCDPQVTDRSNSVQKPVCLRYQRICKTICLFLIGCLAIFSKSLAQSDQVKLGDKIDAVVIDKVLRGDQNLTNLHALAGKVTVLDFWATWCAPCIKAMDHLDELHKKFGDDINIISVSDERENDILPFLKKRTWPFTFVLDTTKRLNEYFPHLVIPHTVVIDKNLQVVAITDPYNVTADVIAELLAGKSVNLEERKFEKFDQQKDYFSADTTTWAKFQVTKKLPSVRGYMQNWMHDSLFAGRRISAINYLVEDMITTTYNASYLKIVVLDSLAARTLSEDYYCFDRIVPPHRKDSLWTDLRSAVLRTFDIRCRIELFNQPVLLLKRVEGFKFK